MTPARLLPFVLVPLWLSATWGCSAHRISRIPRSPRSKRPADASLSSAGQPRQALGRFLDLVSRGKFADAYQIMTPSYREQCDLDCFTRSLTEQRDDLRRVAPLLAQATVELRGDIVLPDPPPLRLSTRDGTWKLVGDPLDFYPQDSPAQALRSFLRALANRRYDVALRFVPSKRKGPLSPQHLRDRFEGPGSAELAAQIAVARRHLGEPLLMEGPVARLVLDEGKEIRLVLEEGLWRVVQLQ